jgi:hypothetical protein
MEPESRSVAAAVFTFVNSIKTIEELVSNSSYWIGCYTNTPIIENQQATAEFLEKRRQKSHLEKLPCRISTEPTCSRFNDQQKSISIPPLRSRRLHDN